MSARYAQNIFAEVFSELGWGIVSSKDSGVLRKDDYLIVVLPNDVKLNHCKKKEKEIHFSFSNPISGKRGHNWHLERNGWWLAGGVFKFDAEKVHNLSIENKKLALNDVIESVKAILDLTDEEQSKIRQREGLVTQKVTKKIPIPIDSWEGVDTFFKVDVEQFPSLGNTFDRDLVYGVLETTNYSIYINKLNKNNSAPLKSKPIELSYDTFKQLISSRAFFPVEFEFVSQDEITIDWVCGQPINSGALPKVLENLPFSLEQKEVLRHAHTEMYNYTSLLDDSLTPQVMQKMIDILALGVDPLALLNHHFDTEQLTVLEKVASGGYNISFLLNDNLNAKSMELRYQDMLVGSENLVASIGLGSAPIDVQDAARRIAFNQRGIKHLIGCQTEAECYLKDYIFRGDNSGLAKLMLDKGRISQTNHKYCSLDWSSLDTEVKLKILKMFSLDNLKFQGEYWNDFLLKLMKRIRNIGFLVGNGFYLSLDLFYLCADKNSVYIANQFFRPLFRAICINDVLLINRGIEDEICL